jgi:hypothetical protein
VRCLAFRGRSEACCCCPGHGGEPLWAVPEGLVIFFLARRRPNMVLSGRLPETTAREVLSPRATREFLIR